MLFKSEYKISDVLDFLKKKLICRMIQVVYPHTATTYAVNSVSKYSSEN